MDLEQRTAAERFSDDVGACFREHRLLREALVALMAAAKAYIEPFGSSAHPAMHQARAALEGREPR